MKVSVSLPEDDVRFLDAFVETQGLGSRSAALQRAVRLLRTAELGSAYEAAWDDWAADGDADAWEPSTADGLGS